MTDFRALCTELLDALQGYIEYAPVLDEGVKDEQRLVVKARAALAQPEPTPTDEELMSVFWEHENGLEEIWACDWPAAARAVLARWGQV